MKQSIIRTKVMSLRTPSKLPDGKESTQMKEFTLSREGITDRKQSLKEFNLQL